MEDGFQLEASPWPWAGQACSVSGLRLLGHWQCGHEGSEMGFPVCRICVPGKHFITCTVPPFRSTGLGPERKRRRDRSCPTSLPQMTDLWTLMPRPVSMLGFCCLECLLQTQGSSIADQLSFVEDKRRG